MFQTSSFRSSALLLCANLNCCFGGGVSANSGIRNYFEQHKEKLNIFFPKIEYTTDNAAMIAMVGYLKYKENKFSNLKLSSKARYKI